MIRLRTSILTVGSLLVLASPALAHVTPPVRLHSDREVVRAVTAKAEKLMVREVRLTAEERDEVARRTGWRPDQSLYRFFVGRDAEGKITAAVIFLSEFTIHGPLRVAVGLGPDGKVIDASVMEMTEETYAAFKPLLDRDFTRSLVGTSGRAALPAAASSLEPQSLARFYAELVTDLVSRGAVLFDVAMLARGRK